jgi:hypothetical protein
MANFSGGTVPQQSPDKWRQEFKELGANRVRSMLLSSDWDRDKKAAARIWIETADAMAWNEKRGDGEGRTPLMLRVRTAKWWRYATPILGALMGLGLLIRRLKAF